jgi:ABC-type amino acid transport substrate-binding protein
MLKYKLSILILLVAALVLAGCQCGGLGRGGKCMGTAKDAIVDLKCREVTIAVENAYLPFNYIDPDTGKADGWDYDVWD